MMDDKQFDAIMKQYVASTNNSAEKDFAKLNKKETRNYSRISSKTKWAFVSFILIIAISLSVFLPVYLKDNKDSAEPPIGQPGENPCEQPGGQPGKQPGGQPGEKPQIQYYDDGDTVFKPIDSLSDLNEAYHFNIMLPTIVANVGENISLILDKDKETILGAYIELTVYDEVDNIIMHVMPNQNSLKLLAEFNSFKKQATWSEYTVNYYIEPLEITDDYSYTRYKMKFSYGNYTYYIEFERFYEGNNDEITIAGLLSLIFD